MTDVIAAMIYVNAAALDLLRWDHHGVKMALIPTTLTHRNKSIERQFSVLGGKLSFERGPASKDNFLLLAENFIF